MPTPDAPTSPPWETFGTCDWGDCDDETVAWRYSGQRLGESPLGWLPVCEKHSRHGVVDSWAAHSDGLDGGRTDG